MPVFKYGCNCNHVITDQSQYFSLLFLWNCVLNSLLVDLRNRGFYVQAYANDVAILVTGTNVLWIKDRAQKALNIASNWAHNQELQFSSKKIEIVLFINKRNPDFGTLRLNGRQLEIPKKQHY